MERNTLIKPEEMTKEMFVIYARLYLTENMFKVVPSTSPLQYGHISTIINGIERVLFEKINTETGKLLLVNKVYSLIRSLTGEEFSKEFLYSLVETLASCMPEMEDEEDKILREIQEMVDDYASRKYDF